MVRSFRAVLCALGALGLMAGAARAGTLLYSYEAVDAPARALAETGLTFVFDKGVFGGARLRQVIQTGEFGSADVRPASEKDLGPGGLRAALGREAPVGSLYEIAPGKDGPAFVGAVCPGAARAWLVVGAFRRYGDLSVQTLGKDPGAAAARHCATLRFTYRSDWRLPPDREPPTPRPFGGLPG